MTLLEFTRYWQSNFAECPPVNYLLKVKFTDKWLRIHSLPDSKRYAENDDDWNILLARQQKIFNDVFSTNDKVVLLANSFQIENDFNFDFIYKQQCLENFDWQTLPVIDVYEFTKNNVDKEEFIIPHLSNCNYELQIIEPILKAIAKDELRLFFINPKTNTIIAPYDGGVDIIYADSETRDLYEEKYEEWEQQDSF
jgi:hypothetical protein